MLCGFTTELLAFHQSGHWEELDDSRTGYVQRPDYLFLKVMREIHFHWYAISALITNLIESRYVVPVKAFSIDFYLWAASQLQPHFSINKREKFKSKTLMEAGVSQVDSWVCLPLFCCFVSCFYPGKADLDLTSGITPSPTTVPPHWLVQESVSRSTPWWFLFPTSSLYPPHCDLLCIVVRLNINCRANFPVVVVPTYRMCPCANVLSLCAGWECR